MNDISIDIDEIDDLDSPVGLYGASGEGSTDMVIDVVTAIAIYTGNHPFPAA